MSLVQYLDTLRRRWLTVVLGCLLGTLAGYLAASAMTPTYTSVAQSYFSYDAAYDSPSATANDASNAAQYLERQMPSYARLAKAPVVTQPVIDRLGLSEEPHQLSARIVSEVPTDTHLVVLRVTASSGEEAQLIAQAVVEQLGRVVVEMSPHNAQGRSMIVSSIVLPPTVPTEPTAPNTRQFMFAGAVAGLAGGIVIAMLLASTDDRVRSRRQIEQITGVPVVAEVATRGRKRGLVTLDDPTGPGAEAIREVRTAVTHFHRTTGGRVLTIAATGQGGAPHRLGADLGVELAASGAVVLLIDANLRESKVGQLFDLQAPGLGEVLRERASLSSAVDQVRDGLYVLGAGDAGDGSYELLAGPAMEGVIERARGQYDFVLVVTSPVATTSDAATVAQSTDGVLLNMRQGHTRRDELAGGVTKFKRVSTPVVGVVVQAG